MCFSERVSWLTLGVSLAGCGALASYSSPQYWVLAGLFVNIALMQLWEALLWRQRGECTPANHTYSKLAAVTNHLEPLVLFGLSALWLKPASPGLKHATWLVVAVYTAVFGYLTYRYLREPQEKACSTVGKDGLVWTWNYGSHQNAYFLFVATMLMIVYAYFPPSSRLGVMGIIGGSFALSQVVYGGTKMVGSMWCFIGALVPWLFVLASQI